MNDFPFTDAEFLRALEEVGPATVKGGWEPAQRVVPGGSMPAYVKTHSYGEYIFDWDWARAYRDHGRRYYPKLVSMVPCTPATGPHLLTAPGASSDTPAALVDAFVKLHDERQTSSAHALFLPPEELPLFVERGFLARETLQFHWSNRGYRDFADYLDAFVGKRRRQIVRERRQVAEQGLVIERRTGAELTAADGRMMHGFYRATVDRKEGLAYLPEAFFERVFATMPDRILLVTAKAGAEVVGASVSFFKGKHLYGRYWGATAEYRSLHFELCYYQTLEFAIARGMTRVEAGAQGPHKIARGFLPSVVHSAHLIRDPAFRGAIARYLDEEARALRETIAGFEGSPFLEG
jgi:predicted N-acyltransferase